MTAYMRHGSIYDERTAKRAQGFSKNMRQHWTCALCKKKFIVTIDELRQHEKDCAERLARSDTSKLSFNEGSDERTDDALVDPSEGMDSRFDAWQCGECGKTFWFSRLDRLRHIKLHSAPRDTVTAHIHNEVDTEESTVPQQSSLPITASKE